MILWHRKLEGLGQDPVNIGERRASYGPNGEFINPKPSSLNPFTNLRETPGFWFDLSTLHNLFAFSHYGLLGREDAS